VQESDEQINEWQQAAAQCQSEPPICSMSDSSHGFTPDADGPAEPAAAGLIRLQLRFSRRLPHGPLLAGVMVVAIGALVAGVGPDRASPRRGPWETSVPQRWRRHKFGTSCLRCAWPSAAVKKRPMPRVATTVAKCGTQAWPGRAPREAAVWNRQVIITSFLIMSYDPILQLVPAPQPSRYAKCKRDNLSDSTKAVADGLAQSVTEGPHQRRGSGGSNHDSLGPQSDR